MIGLVVVGLMAVAPVPGATAAAGAQTLSAACDTANDPVYDAVYSSTDTDGPGGLLDFAVGERLTVSTDGNPGGAISLTVGGTVDLITDVTSPFSISYVFAGPPTDLVFADWSTQAGSVLWSVSCEITEPVTITPGAVSVIEGDAPSSVVVDVPVTLSEPAPPEGVTVSWTTLGTGATPGLATKDVDFAGIEDALLTFAEGEMAKTASVTVFGDDLDEPELGFFGGEWGLIRFFDPSANATISTSGFFGLGVFVIVDDDLAPVIMPGAAAVTEGDPATQATVELEVPVSLSAPSGFPVSVQWSTVFTPGWNPGLAADPTPGPGQDYLAAGGTVNFAPGETDKTVPVTVNSDLMAELDELVLISFDTPTNATVGGVFGLGFGSITNDDLGVVADPSLFPDFDLGVTDYVTRCGVDPVAVSVVAPSGTEVAIDGAAPQSGVFSQDVTLTPGARFEIDTIISGQTTTAHVRCLPADFPDWSWDQPGDPAANFYITTPLAAETPDGQQAADYVAIFDDNGVPVWWKHSDPSIDAKLLPDGRLAWWNGDYNTYELDGTVVDTWSMVGVDTDLHDFELLPNGNGLLGAYVPRPGEIDLTAYGGPATNGTLTDAVIQEVTPGGAVAWSWTSEGKIDPSEVPARWWPTIIAGPDDLPDGRQAFDYVHWNSSQQIGDTVVMSFRHLDAVYAVNKLDGSIIWKLGGTTTPESLTVIGDPESNPLGGQHYARILPDGTLTIYDNNTDETAAPRGVRYALDLNAMTATFIEAIGDPAVTDSFCCGSSAKLPDGSWITSWGGNPVISEFDSTGSRSFTLGFTSIVGFPVPALSYRVDAVVGASPTAADLRAGMDAMS